MGDYSGQSILGAIAKRVLAVIAAAAMTGGLLVGLAGPVQASAGKTSLAVTVSAASVPAGGKVKVTGTLKRDGEGLSKSILRLQKRAVGSRNWTTVAKAKTDAKGQISTTIGGLQRDHEFRALFAGSARAGKSTSSTKKVGVKQAVRISATSSTSPTSGQSITVKGKVSSSLAGRTLQLQQYKGGKWIKVAAAKATRNAAFTLSTKAQGAGTASFRVYATGTTGVRAATSPVRKFTVYKWFYLADSTPLSAQGTDAGLRFVSGPATIDGVQYLKSLLGVLSEFDAEDDIYLDMWALNGKCLRLEATVGFDDEYVTASPVGLFAAFIDREMHEIGFLAADEYVKSRIDLRGADKLSLGMSWDGFSSGAGIAGFADAKVLCSAKP